MYNLLNIPNHKNCNNCGGCCGPVPASKKELENIKDYISKNPETLNKLTKNKALTCIFRSELEKKCLIYPVRPIVCRLMGVAKGLNCDNGNSHNINGHKFIKNISMNEVQILNFVRWER